MSDIVITPPSDLMGPVPIKLALVIPNYNHSAAISQALSELAALNLPCYLIDDGSNDETRYLLQSLAEQHDWVTLLQHPYNRGKGAAVMTGLRSAYRDGFTHALQVDADGDIATDATEPAGDVVYPRAAFFRQRISDIELCTLWSGISHVLRSSANGINSQQCFVRWLTHGLTCRRIVLECFVVVLGSTG